VSSPNFLLDETPKKGKSNCEEIQKLIKTLLEKLNHLSFVFLINLVDFYKYWVIWNYSTFTNAIIN